MHNHAGVERASNADLAFLAMDTARVPEQFAVVLTLDGVIDGPAVGRILSDRTARVPRLRQRLTRTPPGCGRPIWVDDDAFDVGRHWRTVQCATPGDDAALMAAVLPLVMEPLPRDRPLWRAALVGGTALVLVIHHALADGLGGLAVLDQLVEGPAGSPEPAVPRRPPTAGRLAADALRERVRAIRQIGASVRQLRTAMAGSGGIRPARAQACSLTGQTRRPSDQTRRPNDRRTAAVVQTDLVALRDYAHHYGGTVNAALLTAVAESLRAILDQRGETISEVTVAVPVAAAGRPVGNSSSPLLVTVPVTGPPGARIAQTAEVVRRRRELAAGPAPIAVMGGLFRLAAALGGYRWYMAHQRRLHTVVSYVRGPERLVRFGGVTVRRMIPLVVGDGGNVTVAFQALSYAGTLTVTAVADPDRCPDLPLLARTLGRELGAR